MSAESTLFAYGSLMFPEVWWHVVGHERPSVPATLRGHSAFTVRGYSFPGLLQSTPESTTPGRLYFELDAEDWRKLDEFEDRFYVRQRVEVETENAGKPLGALAYLVDPSQSSVLSEQMWDPSWFGEHALGDFLDRISGFEPST